MTRDEQFRALLRLYTASIEHNIVLRGKLTISQPISAESDAILKRIYRILFDGEFRDQDGFLITPAADRNLLRAIGTFKAAYDHDHRRSASYKNTQRNKLLGVLGRVHDQLQDVRNIYKGEGYE